MDATGASPRAIRRAEYQPPKFRVRQLDLDFTLEPAATIVRARTTIERVGSSAMPLILDGVKLDLISVLLDGRPLSSDLYVRTDSHLTIPNIGPTADLEIVTRIDPDANTSLDGLYRSSGSF